MLTYREVLQPGDLEINFMQFFVPHCYTSAVFLTYPTPAGSQNHTEREGNCLYHLTMSLAAPQLVKEREEFK